jgi:hypothetical protein
VIALDKWINVSIGLGMLALAAVVTGHLALVDIYHGEADVSLEWGVLRICFVVIAASQVIGLFTLTKLRHKRLRK